MLPDSLLDPEAALQPSAAVDEIQVAGALPDGVAVRLGMVTAARSVWLHPHTVQHIHSQREAGEGDAEFVLEHLPAAVLRPHYCGTDRRHAHRYDLVHITEAGRPVFVAIKLVLATSARSRADEIWISTAHLLPANFLSRKRYRDGLFALDPAEVSRPGASLDTLGGAR